ncbi:MAG: hypothetical protein OT477_17275 [Chloroflexi bacterium]|nr:hypothetical protein [Chloroflexota bacterium]
MTIPQSNPNKEINKEVAGIFGAVLALLLLYLLFSWLNLFLVALAILAGIYCVLRLYQLLRPTLPERWVLREDGLQFDGGSPPIQIDSTTYYRWGILKRIYIHRIELGGIFQRPQTLFLSLKELNHLRLHQRPSGNQLLVTYDNNTQQLELAQGATNWDREWLFQYLQTYYHLDNE